MVTRLVRVGRHNEAIAEMKRAMEVESLSLQQGANFAAVYMYARQFDLAVGQARKTYDLDPSFVSGQIGPCRGRVRLREVRPPPGGRGNYQSDKGRRENPICRDLLVSDNVYRAWREGRGICRT